MPPPIAKLVDSGNRDFPFSGWQAVFAEHYWFYAAGFTDIATFAGLTDKRVKLQCGEVPKAIPADWKAYVPAGEWRILATTQIDRASGRRPQRFEKACMSLLALERALLANAENLADQCRKQPGETDAAFVDRVLWNHVSIRPAIYRIDGLASHLTKLEKDHALLADLRDATPYVSQNMNLYKHIAQGYSVTFRTAKNICEFLGTRKFDGLAIRRIASRLESGYRGKRANGDPIPHKSPTPLEFVSVNLGPA